MDKICKNCNTVLAINAKYCPNCGQKYAERVSVGFLFKRLLSTYISVDSKLFKTLIPLFAKPGYIAKQYIGGVRSKYLEPVQILFFSVFVLFLTLNFAVDYEQIESQIFKAISEEHKDFYAESDGMTTTQLYAQIDSLRKIGKYNHEIYDWYADKDMTYSQKFLIKVLTQNSTGIIKEFLNQIWLTLLCLLPVYTLFLYLLNYRKRLNYAEQLTHVIYLVSVAMLVGIPLILLSQQIVSIHYLWVYMLLMAVYALFSFKHFYEDKWYINLLKVIVSSLVILLALIPSILLGSLLLTMWEY